MSSRLLSLARPGRTVSCYRDAAKVELRPVDQQDIQDIDRMRRSGEPLVMVGNVLGTISGVDYKICGPTELCPGETKAIISVCPPSGPSRSYRRSSLSGRLWDRLMSATGRN